MAARGHQRCFFRLDSRPLKPAPGAEAMRARLRPTAPAEELARPGCRCSRTVAQHSTARNNVRREAAVPSLPSLPAPDRPRRPPSL